MYINLHILRLLYYKYITPWICQTCKIAARHCSGSPTKIRRCTCRRITWVPIITYHHWGCLSATNIKRNVITWGWWIIGFSIKFSTVLSIVDTFNTYFWVYHLNVSVNMSVHVCTFAHIILQTHIYHAHTHTLRGGGSQLIYILYPPVN